MEQNIKHRKKPIIYGNLKYKRGITTNRLFGNSYGTIGSLYEKCFKLNHHLTTLIKRNSHWVKMFNVKRKTKNLANFCRTFL